MAQQYKPSPEEKKRIEFVQWRFNTARDFFKNNVQDKFDSYYKDYREDASDRKALLIEQKKEWASNVFVPVTSSYVRWITAKIADAKPELRIIGRNSDDMQKAEKVQTLMQYIWDKNEMEKELKKLINQSVVFWTWIWKVSWKKKYIKSTKDVVDEETLEIKQITESKEEFNDPTFETVDVYWFFPDPQWYSIESCRYVCQRYLLTKQQIFTTYWKENIKNTEFLQNWTWDLTILDDVRNTVNTSKNWSNTPKATDNQIEVIEYWEDDRLTVIAWDVMIKDEENPFPFKKKPFVSLAYDVLPFEFYGVWVAEQLKGSQALINKIRNQRIDQVTMSLNQPFLLNDMAIPNKEDLELRPWWFIRVLWQDIDSAIRPLQMPQVSGNAYQEDQLIFDAARQATWLDSYSIWQSEAASTSASSVIASKEASALRIKQFVRWLETEVYTPIFRMWLELAKEFYPNDTAERVINEETWEDEIKKKMPIDIRKEENWQFSFEDISKEDLYWIFDFRVLSDSWIAASKELNKQNSLNLLDRAATVWTNPQTWEQYVNMKALWKDVLNDFNKDSSELMWNNTQQEQQDAQQNQQGFEENKMMQQQQWWWDQLSQTSNANLWWTNAPKQQF